jgi:hypothetical protein
MFVIPHQMTDLTCGNNHTIIILIGLISKPWSGKARAAQGYKTQVCLVNKQSKQYFAAARLHATFALQLRARAHRFGSWMFDILNPFIVPSRLRRSPRQIHSLISI